MSSREEIIREIERYRAAITELERQIGEPTSNAWPPVGFYLTFYVVSGIIIGILGSLVSFIFNVLGSLLVKQDPLMILRIYGTIFLGEKALVTDDLTFFLLVAIVHFSVGACAGASYHLLMNWLAPDRGDLHVALGVVYGVILWLVNFYGVIWWLQPMLVGRAYILDNMPMGIAALTHISYGLTLGLLQPLGRFIPYRSAAAA